MTEDQLLQLWPMIGMAALFIAWLVLLIAIPFMVYGIRKDVKAIRQAMSLQGIRYDLKKISEVLVPKKAPPGVIVGQPHSPDKK